MKKLIIIKLGQATSENIGLVLSPTLSTHPSVIRTKNCDLLQDNKKEILISLSEEQNQFVSDYSTQFNVSKAELIEGIVNGIFAVGLNSVGKKWVCDNIQKKRLSLSSKASCINSMIDYAIAFFKTSKKLQTAIESEAARARLFSGKREYTKIKTY